MNRKLQKILEKVIITIKKNEKSQNINTIIINNNINTYNVNINNFSNCNDKVDSMLKKRNRFSSYEGEYGFCNFKKFDEKEYIDNFNCTFKNIKNDFEIEKELEEFIMVTHSEDNANSLNQFNIGDSGYCGDNLINEKDNLFGNLMIDFNGDVKVNKIN